MLPTSIKDYVLALANKGMTRFSDEPRECRKIRVILPNKRRVEVEIPIAMLEAEREERHLLACLEAQSYLAREKEKSDES